MDPNERSTRAHGPSGAWSLWIVIPLDALGLYFVLAALELIPSTWPAPQLTPWATLCGAVVLFASARAVALFALQRLLRWRIASDTWRKLAASQRAHTR